MAHEVIGTAVMVMATVIILAALLNAIFPYILSGADSIRSTGRDTDNRVATSLAFTNYEVVSPSGLRFDVLNTGRTQIAGTMINISTVYLGKENEPLSWLTFDVSESQTYWNYTVTGTDGVWDQGETLVLQITNPTGTFAEGNYRLRLQLYNGAMSEEAFTV